MADNFLLLFVGWFLYMSLMEGTIGATVGKLLLGIRVVREGDLLIGEFSSSIMPGFLFRTAFLAIAQDELIMAGVGSGKGRMARGYARVRGRPDG